MDQQVVTIISLAGGWTVALVLALTSYFERRANNREDRVLKALDYLTGGTQRRSVGIAILEGMWRYSRRFRNTIVPALTNQALYLLLESEAGSERHEFNNWLRIMGLIMGAKPEPKFRDHYIEIHEALTRRTEVDFNKGISMTNPQAKLWVSKFAKYAGL